MALGLFTGLTNLINPVNDINNNMERYSLCRSGNNTGIKSRINCSPPFDNPSKKIYFPVVINCLFN